MSFDILFHTCNLGTRLKRGKNPFTGKPIMVFDDPGLTSEEREAVRRLLKKTMARGPDEFGVYRLRFPDGGEADFHGSTLAEGAKLDSGSVATRSLSPQVIKFLFQLSLVGNMVGLPVAEGVGGFVTSEGQRQLVFSRWPIVKVVPSVAALAAELRPAFEIWQEYRTKVIGKDE